MRSYLLIFVFLLTVFVKAQVPNWQWAKGHGSTAAENISGLAVNSIGESYACGYYFSSNFTLGTTTLTNNGNYDSYVAKFDVNGNPLWAKSFGGGFDDNATAIAIDGSGNSYVVGNFISSTMVCGTTTLTNSAFGDLFIVKLDVTGNFVWAKNFGDGGNTVATAVTVDATGNIHIAGFYNSATLTIGTYTLTTFGNDDAFVAKLDANGNVLWAKSFGDNLAENANGITTDPSGNSYITGFYKSTNLTVGSTTLSNASPASADIFLVKMDNAGNVLNAATFGDMLDEVGTGITRDVNGDIILTGYYFSPTLVVGTSSLTNNGSRDVLVIKTNSNCTVQWAQGGGGNNDDYGYGIAADAVGRIYVNGHNHSFLASFGTQTLSFGGVGDGFLVAYSSTGTALWADGVGGGTDDGWNALALDGAGNIYCGGYFSSTSVSLGSTNLNCNGSGDLLLAKMLNTTGLDFTANHENDFIMYPNPSAGVVHFKSLSADYFGLEIYDAQGKLQVSLHHQPSDLSLDLSYLPKGMYLTRLKIGEAILTKKLLIN